VSDLTWQQRKNEINKYIKKNKKESKKLKESLQHIKQSLFLCARTLVFISTFSF